MNELDVTLFAPPTRPCLTSCLDNKASIHKPQTNSKDTDLNGGFATVVDVDSLFGLGFTDD